MLLYPNDLFRMTLHCPLVSPIIMGIDYNLARRVTTSGVDSIVLWRGEYQPLARAA